ncbi:3'(2'),5'-bisphosphate nucleotidase CysQ family protein [Salinivibrio costicola]|uniref:3'(2'),5'-bisphosphate nucleotidase CysQ family protein n=1 Tax=Salinivibrio costicola TaxID=51367 RepID=UPI003F72D32C
MISKIEKIMVKLGDNLKIWLTKNGKEGQWEGAQFKAKADQMAHEFLVAELTKLTPFIPILSEEDEASLVQPRPSKYWLIDPIDGTASYVNGFSGYVTQIVLIENEKPILAVIYAPELKLLYSARKGEGAFLNHVPLPTLDERGSRKLIDNYPEPRGIAKRIYDGIECTDYIESGSLGLKLLRIADGTADIFVKDVIVKDWDVAPAQLVLSELGCEVYNIDGDLNSFNNSYDINGIVCCRTTELKELVIGFIKDNK